MFKMNVFIQHNMGAGVAAFTMRMRIIEGGHIHTAWNIPSHKITI